MYNKPITRLVNNRLLRINQKHRQTIPYDQAQKIGIVIDKKMSREAYEGVNELIREMTEDGKKVKVACFRNGESIPLEARYIPFSKKDFKLNGTLKNSPMKQFVATPFDYLFSISPSLSFSQKIILAQSKAKCRIGKYQEKKEKYFELMVQQNSGQDFKDLVRQMNIFAKKIRA